MVSSTGTLDSACSRSRSPISRAPHLGEAFPTVSPVPAEEVEQLRRALCEREHLRTDTRWAALLKHLLGRSKPVASVSAEDEEAFDLTTIVAALGITPEEHVYVSWDPGRDEVDRLAFQDLAHRFAWIWYPSSDDIPIFDRSLT